jgi:cyclohexanone monooxygenase
MYMLHKARSIGLTARAFEAGSGVGGTWYWNRYPGARCDVDSLEYSYQFDEALQQEWKWSQRYSPQPEILRYAEHVAERFGLTSDIQFDTRVEAAVYDEDAGRWNVRTSDGAEASAQFLILATGCLSSAKLPEIEGIESFAGERYHTGKWPHHAVDFSGKRVGMIGTGSSAIQSIPLIAREAKSLTVFQRTPTYTVPARNRPTDPAYEARVKSDYAGFRERNSRMPNAFGTDLPRNEVSALSVGAGQRTQAFEERWQHGGLPFMGAFNDLLLNAEANAAAAEFVRGKIQETVQDPATAARLAPRQTIGCKRLCVDTDYYATFNRPNVRLVDLRESPLEAITPAGVHSGGVEHAFDCLIFATGFDAMTGALMAIDIRGRGGLALRDKWRDGPRSYLGLGSAGFPNLFTISGPGSPSVLTNMMVSIEQHVNWIGGCLDWMRSQRRTRIEATPQAETAWGEHVNAVADRTLYPTCNSWYLGANVPGKPRVFMPLVGFPPYVEKCNEVAARGYEGFALS